MARFSGPGDDDPPDPGQPNPGPADPGPADPGPAPRRLFIDGYGPGFFRIVGERHVGSVIVLPDRVLAWPVTEMAGATAESLTAFIECAGDTDLLLLGTGPRMTPVPPDMRRMCRDAGVTVEPMDTGAAARTYNVLLAEDRRVAAALIAV